MKATMYLPLQSNFVGAISRPKLSGGGRHAGVLLPNGQVAHKSTHGSEITSLQEFAQGLLITCDHAAHPARHTQIQWRAYESIGRTPPYDLLTSNCEHYATMLMDEKPKSPQIAGMAVLSVLCALAAMA